MANVSYRTNCISLSNQLCRDGPILTDINPNEYNQELTYYSFMVNWDCTGSYNTINDISGRICVSNKTEVVNLSVFNMIARINKSKTLTKHISRKCKCKCDAKNVTQIRSGICINGSVGAKIQKEMSVRKNYIWKTAAWTCENDKYLGSIIGYTVFTSDEVLDTAWSET